MSKLLKVILLGAYSALFIQFIKSILKNKYVELIEIEYVLEKRPLLLVQQELLKKPVVTLINQKFKKLQRVLTDYKYVLNWDPATSHYHSPVSTNGQRPFLINNCPVNNCYMTNDKSILPDIRHYDAILFDVENTWNIYPEARSKHQKYIFVSSESAADFPTCNSKTEDFYNLTWTYKLDSDIRFAYITVVDINDTFVGPKLDVKWIEAKSSIHERIRTKIQSKNKTAAWFVSQCRTSSNTKKVADKIMVASKKYGLEIDVYGRCGTMKCPKDRWKDCLELLKNQYYFYLAFENSLAKDYVTDRVLHALQHYTVPIVYGGANYSRFLPPGSYIDASILEAETVALKMFQAISHSETYHSYFRWHNHYKFKQTPQTTDVCKLCETLNEPIVYKSKKSFKEWWNEPHAKCYNNKKPLKF